MGERVDEVGGIIHMEWSDDEKERASFGGLRKHIPGGRRGESLQQEQVWRPMEQWGRRWEQRAGKSSLNEYIETYRPEK